MRRRLAQGLTGAALALAACAPAVMQDPGYFWFTTRDGAALGDYNPAGFTVDEVKGVVAGICTGGQLAKYSEQRNAEGVMVFGATCATGSGYGPGRVAVERRADGTLDITFSPY